VRHVLPCLPLFFDFLRNVGFGSERANEREETNRKRVVRERDCEIFFVKKKGAKKQIYYRITLTVLCLVCVCFHLVFTERVTEENVNKRR